jgi:RND superfamily putative drug exporter
MIRLFSVPILLFWLALTVISIAALLGRWFWWPQRVRSRPARHGLPSDDPDTAPLPTYPNTGAP